MSKSTGEIRIALIQTELVWENSRANIQKFDRLIKNIEKQVDLILLPETFSTGFTMNVEAHADHNLETLDWMIETAKNRSIHLAGSIITKQKSRYYNRFYWVSPTGKFVHYDKRHLFRMGREEQHFSPGKERVIVKLRDFRFLLQVCYDLRFPVFSRNRNDYDAIIYVANWPLAREYVWNSLLVARAIENQSYVIGVNCCGTDGEGVENCGESCVIDAKGKYLDQLNDQPGILYSTLDIEEIRTFREKFPVWRDADDFRLGIS